MMVRALLTPTAVVVALVGAALAQTSPGDSTFGAQMSPPAASATAPMTFLSARKESEKSASEVIGTSIVDKNGESIGKISDVILNQDQRAVGAVLLIGGVMGIGGKSVGVPWQAVSFQTKDGKQVASVAFSREALDTAPEFKTQAQLRSDERAKTLQQQLPVGSQRPAAPASR
jgi:sporulation protein YlmC with PRC-barrel domain